MKARRRTRLRGGLFPWAAALLIAAVTVLGCELAVRVVPLRLFQDVLREFIVSGRLRFDQTRDACGAHGGAPFLRPGLRIEDRASNLRYRYSTGSVRVDDCVHGFRFNGHGDAAPVHGLVLGDSFTEAIRASDGETWVSALSRLTGRRFLNFGCGGQGTTYHRRVAEAVVPAVKPRAVVLQICDNDAFDDMPPEAGPPPPRPSGPWRRALEWRGMRHRSVLWYALARWGFPARRAGGRGGGQSMSPEQAALQKANIQAIHARVASGGGRLAVVAFANDDYLKALDLPDWCARRGVPLVRGYAALDGFHVKTVGYRTDPHPNAVGNLLIARLVAVSLRDWDGLRP